MKLLTVGTAAAVVAICLTASACSSSSTVKPMATTNTPTAVTTPTVDPVPTESPTPEPTAAAPLSLGDTAQFSYTNSSGTGSLTVYAYKQPVASGAPRPQTAGYTWGAIDVKECAGENGVINNEPWTLVYADDTQLEPSSLGYNQFPAPEFPFGDKSLLSGRCIRGWITYPVPKNAKPTMVEFALGGDGSVVDWTV